MSQALFVRFCHINGVLYMTRNWQNPRQVVISICLFIPISHQVLFTVENKLDKIFAKSPKLKGSKLQPNSIELSTTNPNILYF